MDATVARTGLLVLMTLASATAAAGAFPGASTVADAVTDAIPAQGVAAQRIIPAGGSTAISASLQNPLDTQDVLQIRFSGPAVDRGHVSVDVPPDARTSCDTERQVCEIRLRGGETAEITVMLHGERPGRGQMDIAVVSATTGKQAHARTLVIVTGETVVDAVHDLLDRLFRR